MSQPRDDWDDEERRARRPRRGTAGIRRRHADDPSLALLRAAAADALPPTSRHASRVTCAVRGAGPWSTDCAKPAPTIASMPVPSNACSIASCASAASRSARHGGGGDDLRRPGGRRDAADRRRDRATGAPRATPGPRRRAAATGRTPAPAPSAPVRIAFVKPEVKLSASALTWRGDPSANPFLRDLAPAFDAYRASDYARAVAAFDRLATVYPDSIDVRFYQGVSRMLAGDEAGAIAPLEAAARIGDTFADDVSWFLAVALQRSGRPEARGRLVELCRGRSLHAAAACAAVTQIDPPPALPPRR